MNIGMYLSAENTLETNVEVEVYLLSSSQLHSAQGIVFVYHVDDQMSLQIIEDE
jgi:imidazoleglycerol phosphate dehydratase HisB